MVGRDQVDFIFQVLRDARAGKPSQEIACEYGVDETKLCEWDGRYGGMTRAQLERVRQLEAENLRLAYRVAEREEENQVLNRAWLRILDGVI